MGFAFALPILRAISSASVRSPHVPKCDRYSPPVWPPPPLIADPRRHQRRAVWIDPVVFRAITISRNTIIIPRRWPYHRDNHPQPWLRNDFTNHLGLPRPGFST